MKNQRRINNISQFTRLLLVLFIGMVPFSLHAGSLDSVQRDYLYGNYNEVIEACLGKINRNVNDEALYFAGLSFSKLGAYPKARGYFRRLLREFKDSPSYDKTLLKLVDTYFLEGNLGKAQSLYKSILRKYPNLSYKPLTYLRLAQISAKKGNWQNMHHYVDIIKYKYADSAENKLAKRLESRGDFFTVQVGAFSGKSNAVRFSKRLKRGYPVYIAVEKEDNFTLYKVRIGKYRSKAQAEYMLNKLVNEGYPARIYP